MMRRLILNFLLVCLWQAQATLQDCCPAGCFDVSQTLNLGDTLQSITLDNSSQYNQSEICGVVFTNRGSCCQMSRMKSYTTKMVNRIKSAMAGIESTLAVAPQLVSAIPRIMGVFHRKMAVGGVYPDEVFVDTLGGPHHFEQMKVMTEYLSTQIGSLNKQIAEKKYNATKCYDTLLRSKLSSVCMACSGNASDYYDSTTKQFRIKRSYCSSLVTDCAQVFDVYNKVNTVLKISRMFKISMTVQGTEEAVSEEFSLDRMLSYDACLSNLADCVKNDQRLLPICRDFNVLADVTLVKLSYNTNTDASTLSADASGAYSQAFTGQIFLFTNIVNNINTNIQEYANTAGIQSKMVTLDTTIANLVTQDASYVTADNAIRSNPSPPNMGDRTTRRNALNQIMPFRSTLYTNVAAISKKVLTDLASEMVHSTPTEFEVRREFYLKLEKLYVLISEAQNLYSTLSQARAEYEAYETGLATTPANYDVVRELNYFMLYANFSAVHNQVKIDYLALKERIKAYSVEKTTALGEVKTAYDTYKTKVTQISNNLQPQLTVDSKNLELAYLQNNKSLEDSRVVLLTNYMNDLTALKVLYAATSDTLLSHYNSMNTELTALSSSLAGLLGQISTIASANFYSGLNTLLSNTNTVRNGYVAGVVTSFTTIVEAKDPILDLPAGGFTSALRGNLATLLDGITSDSGLKTAANQAILKSKASMSLAYVNHQNALQRTFQAYSQFEIAYKNYTTLMNTLLESLGLNAATDAQMTALKLKHIGLKALLSTDTPAYLPCNFIPLSSTACNIATSTVSTAASEETRITGELNTFLSSTWPANYSSLSAQRDTVYSNFVSQLSALQSAQVMTTGWSKIVTDCLNEITGNMTAISTIDRSVSLKTNQIFDVNRLIARYQAASQNAPAGDRMTLLIYFQEVQRFLGDFSTLLTNLTGNTTVTPNSYVNILTTQNTTLTTLISKAVSMGATQAAKKAPIVSSLDAELTWATTNLTDTMANVTAIQASIDAAVAIVSLTTPQIVPVARRLQTRQATEDFILSELNGADVNVQFVAGVDPVLDLSSAEGYTPGNLSAGGNLTSNNTGNTCRLISTTALALLSTVLVQLF